MVFNADIVIIALVYASPFMAYFLIRHLRTRFGQTPTWLLGACLFILISGVVLPMTDNSFTTRFGNLLLCVVFIFAYCCITVVIWHGRDVAKRAVLGVFALLPLLATFAVVFMMTDFSHGRIWGSSDHGYQRQDFDHGYACETSAYRTFLYREWAAFPLIEHQVFEESKSSTDTRVPDCAKLVHDHQVQQVCQADSTLCHS